MAIHQVLLAGRITLLDGQKQQLSPIMLYLGVLACKVVGLYYLLSRVVVEGVLGCQLQKIYLKLRELCTCAWRCCM